MVDLVAVKGLDVFCLLQRGTRKKVTIQECPFRGPENFLCGQTFYVIHD